MIAAEDIIPEYPDDFKKIEAYGPVRRITTIVMSSLWGALPAWLTTSPMIVSMRFIAVVPLFAFTIPGIGSSPNSSSSRFIDSLIPSEKTIRVSPLSSATLSSE